MKTLEEATVFINRVIELGEPLKTDALIMLAGKVVSASEELNRHKEALYEMTILASPPDTWRKVNDRKAGKVTKILAKYEIDLTTLESGE